jgi:acyl transferase domain-containing protein
MMSVSGTIDRHYANMLSVECRCKTLDASADGFIEGEATGIMSMTSALRASGEGVSISGTAVNQDGHSASLTAPNGPAQTRVIREALCSANMQGEEMESISLHGTGTPLGDPIELGAALGALQDCKKLMLDAVKSHVGHCETAAGIVALLRAHATVSDSIAHPVLHLRSLNQHCSSIIQTSDTNAPIVIPRQKVDVSLCVPGYECARNSAFEQRHSASGGIEVCVSST